MTRIVVDIGGPALFIAGLALVVAALWILHPAAGLGASGVGCMALAVMWSRAVEATRNEDRR